jgi:hypothetical protein
VQMPPLVWLELAPLAFWLDPAAVVDALMWVACCNSTSSISVKTAWS